MLAPPPPRLAPRLTMPLPRTARVRPSAAVIRELVLDGSDFRALLRLRSRRLAARSSRRAAGSARERAAKAAKLCSVGDSRLMFCSFLRL